MPGVFNIFNYLEDGTLDTSFGAGGDGTNYSEVNAVDIQPDGKIVVAGTGTQRKTRGGG
jgi:Domain of unknown function (DUF5122) beta-propeller